MFIRFRQVSRRLKIYIVETSWRAGKVRQETIAYLGSIEAALVPTSTERERESIEARIAFWEAVNPKLKNLANRLGDDLKRLRMVVHARIPWPMQLERDRLEVLRAQKDADFWHSMYQHNAKMIEVNEALTAKVKDQNSALRTEGLRAITAANEWAAKAAALQRKMDKAAK